MPQNLTPRQVRAITAVLTEPDLASAAKAVGVSRDTLYRWMSTPAFTKALREAEATALASVTRSMVLLAEDATGALRWALTNPAVPPGTKVRAAEIVLSNLIRLRELVTLEERVVALEQTQEHDA